MKRRFKILMCICLVLSFGLTVVGIAQSRPSIVNAQSQSTSSASPAGADIVVPTSKTQSTEQALANRAKSSWPWYLTRAAGLTAAVTLVILILDGVGQITGYTFGFLEPITAWATHRALGIAFGVSILVHVATIWLDKFVSFSIPDILIPFWSHYRPLTLFGFHLGSLYVALGVIAFYLTAAVVISSLFWVESRPSLWKLIHFLSYAIIACVFVHALYMGTDFAHGIFRWLWIGAGVLIAWAIMYRLWRARTV